MAKKIITLEQARQAKQKVISILENQPNLHAGVGLASTVSGYAVKIHLSSSLPKDFSLPKTVSINTEVVGESLEVPVNTEIVGEGYAL
ncbi:hypothetical protein [Nostoc sp. FACHB-190]|uniref:hypothetical protein n=1 Tax=Nostoc sp. FACHB-190 TaxID=2692838 RepID=UPI0016899E25|nr:hypothetical protein [Nostoc sp. FACHB-190]MBD2298603.1 hypothetical protein [Nostoc sp. FACHB-190]